jgi:hypothetical protein
MRAPDAFTGPANTGDSGVFTATAMSLLIRHSEVVPRWLGNGQGPLLGARKPPPLWPVWQTRPLPGSYGFLLGISMVMVAVKAVCWELRDWERKFTQFQGLRTARSV